MMQNIIKNKIDKVHWILLIICRIGQLNKIRKKREMREKRRMRNGKQMKIIDEYAYIVLLYYLFHSYA
jgi:hypothetical protein